MTISVLFVVTAAMSNEEIEYKVGRYFDLFGTNQATPHNHTFLISRVFSFICD